MYDKLSPEYKLKPEFEGVAEHLLTISTAPDLSSKDFFIWRDLMAMSLSWTMFVRGLKGTTWWNFSSLRKLGCSPPEGEWKLEQGQLDHLGGRVWACQDRMCPFCSWRRAYSIARALGDGCSYTSTTYTFPAEAPPTQPEFKGVIQALRASSRADRSGCSRGFTFPVLRPRWASNGMLRWFVGLGLIRDTPEPLPITQTDYDIDGIMYKVHNVFTEPHDVAKLAVSVCRPPSALYVLGHNHDGMKKHLNVQLHRYLAATNRIHRVRGFGLFRRILNAKKK
jgi:hypothetical protein